MASILNAVTTGAGGIVATGDTSGDLNIQSGGSTKIAVTSGGVAVTGLSKASLPTGSVLQVVQGTSSTEVAMTATTYTALGLAASITPTSVTSKIYVIAELPSVNGNGPTSTMVTIYRNGTNLGSGSYSARAQIQFPSWGVLNVGVSTLDSPATTSSITYSIYAKVGGGTTYFNNGSITSTITLMEIAA